MKVRELLKILQTLNDDDMGREIWFEGSFFATDGVSNGFGDVNFPVVKVEPINDDGYLTLKN